MAVLTFAASQPYDVSGLRRRTVGQYTGPASYVTGGDPFAANEVSIGVLDYVSFEVASDGTNIRLVFYDHANGKVLWFLPDTGAQVANAVDLSSYNCRFEAIGQ